MAKPALIGKIAVKVYPDTSDFRSEVKRDLERIENGMKILIPVGPDTKRLKVETLKAVRELNRDIRGDKAFEVKVPLTVEHDKVQVYRERDKIQRELGELKVNVDPESLISLDLDKASVQKVKEQIRDAFDTTIKIPVELDRRGLNDVDDGFGRLGKTIRDQRTIFTEVKEAMQGHGQAMDDYRKRQEEFNGRIKNWQQIYDDANLDLKLEYEDVKQAHLAVEAFDDLIRDVKDDIRVEVALHGNGAEEVADLKRKLDDLEREQIDVIVHAELSEEEYLQTLHKLDEIKEELDDLTRERDADINPNLLFTRDVALRLARLARDRFVNIVPRMNELAYKKVATQLAALAGLRMTGNVLDQINDFVKNIDKNLPLITVLSSTIGALGASVIAATSNLLSLGKSLAQIGPLALTLPGILGGFVVGLLGTVLALSDTNEIMPDVIDRFKDLKAVVSDSFWKEAEEPLRNMAERILPMLETGFDNLGTALGNWFGAIGTALADEFDEDLPEMFENLVRSIEISTEGAEAFANIISTLGKTGSRYLPRLAQYFNDISERFSNFIQEAEDDGRLEQWIETGIERLKELGEVIFNTGGILSGLARAADAAGGSNLRSLADQLERIHEVIDTPEFQTQMTEVFRAAHQAMSNIAKESGPALNDMFKRLADTAETLLPAIGSAFGEIVETIGFIGQSDQFNEGLVDFFEGLGAAVRLAQPGLVAIGEAFGTLLSVIGEVAPNFGKVLGSVLETLADTFEAIAPYIGPISENLSGVFLKALEEIGPLLPGLAESIGEFAVELLELLNSDRVGQIIEDVADALKDFLTPDRIDRIADALLSLAEGLAGLLGALSDGDTGKMSALGGVLKLLGEAVDEVAATIENVGIGLDLLTTPLDELPAKVRSIRDRTINEWSSGDLKEKGVIGAIQSQFLDLAASFGVFIYNLRTEYIPKFTTAAKEVIQGFLDGLSSKAQAIADKATEIWEGFINWVKDLLGINSPSTVFIAIAKDVIAGFLQGLTEGLGKVLDKGKAIADKVIEGVKSAIGKLGEVTSGIRRKIYDGLTAAYDGVKARATTIADRFRDGLRTAIGKAGTALSDTRSRIYDGITAAYESVRGRGETVASRFVSGLRTAIGKAGTALSDIRARIYDGITAAYESVRGRGATIGNRLASGIRSTAGTVRDAVRGIVNSLAGVVNSNALYSSGANIAQGLANGIRSRLGAAQAAAAALATVAKAAAEARAKIMSPSRVFMEIGAYMGEGMAIGMDNERARVQKAAQSMAASVENGFESGFKNLMPYLEKVADDIASTDLSTQVTVGNGSRAQKALAGFGESLTPATSGRNGPLIGQIINNNPQAEPTSVSVNKALQVAGAIGLLG